MQKQLTDIQAKIFAGERVALPEAHFLYREAKTETLQALATAVKERYHPAQQATYLLMAIVNYTNVCVANCDFCSFFRFPHQEGGYLLTTAQLKAKIEQFIELGVTLIAFNGGFNPKLRISDYADLFAELHSTYGKRLSFFEMTVAEFMFACKLSKLSYAEGAKTLYAAGTRWVTGGGAEVLVDSFRQRHSSGKYTVEDYYQAQRAILASGISSTATMVIGFDETIEERLEHLRRLRLFQDEQEQRLASFLCWTYKPENNRLGGKEISVDKYLRWLALCRIYLDNFTHIRTSVLTKNEQALRALAFGADDFDIPFADEVTEKAGATIAEDYRQVLVYAEELGYNPQRREVFSTQMAKDTPCENTQFNAG